MSTKPPDRPQGRHRDASRGGFVLLETLIALAVAALLLAMLSRSFLSIWHGTAHAREDLQAMLIGNTVLEISLPRQTLAPGVRTGSNGGYAWRAEVAPASTLAAAVAPGELPAGLVVEAIPDASRRWQLYRVVVTVVTPTGRKVMLDAYRLGS